jgi:hypothetical protein
MTHHGSCGTELVVAMGTRPWPVYSVNDLGVSSDLLIEPPPFLGGGATAQLAGLARLIIQFLGYTQLASHTQ